MIKTKKLGFSEVRQAFRSSETCKWVRPFVSDEFVMLMNSPFIDGLANMGTPYIIEDVRVVLVTKGSAVVTVNLIDHEVKEGDIVIINYGAILQPRTVSPDFCISGMMISHSLLHTIVGDKPPQQLFMSGGMVFVGHSSDETAMAKRMIDTIWMLVQKYGYIEEVLQPALRMYVKFLEMLSNRVSDMGGKKLSHSTTLFSRFVELVNKYCEKEHSIGFYADKLCISNHYLCSLIKQSSGMTVKEWIDKALITQAKMLLKSTDSQVSQISSRLGFSNPSFFGKFFKQRTGMTPQAYRES